MPEGRRSRRRPRAGKPLGSTLPLPALRLPARVRAAQERDEFRIVNAMQARFRDVPRRRHLVPGGLERGEDHHGALRLLEQRDELAAVQFHAAVVARVQRRMDHLHRAAHAVRASAA